jgi:hypothetical protein
MSEFFSNFVPFSNNGFVYFERGEDSSYSAHSSDESLGYDEEAEEMGLYDEQIELLPRHLYSKRGGTDEQCTICISSIRHNEMVRRLPCQHIFHSECIDHWLKKKALCPFAGNKLTLAE